ncbi:hypothetical protein POF51_25855 [Brevibacillus sp. AG]|uniref:hypothetical protein n=1 Tax=Brevibacillus sp. AG TaxID=3020891 RepID=UPI00232E6F06|nr:hypothetical protein [Brevibacillus sp. AG]MDC0764148.1 hypothetical protein [Brevibacillus sp. AG]
MTPKKALILMFMVISLFSFTTMAFGATKVENDELIQKVSGQKPGQMDLNGVGDEAAMDSAIAIAEFATKFCALVFFCALLIQLFGKVIQHPGYTKWSRLLIGGTVMGFIIIRMAPIVIYGM